MGLVFLGWGLRAQGPVSGSESRPVLRSESRRVLDLTIDLRQTAQTIENIGASGCWYSEPIGRYWPVTKKKQLARWLFSRGFDSAGDPAGIGLSAWRFNIGGGTAEQGDSSGIDQVWRRAECFLAQGGANGAATYDWSKQAGYLWFVHQAYAYGVEKLIAFCNTPPVSMTKNGLGYKTEKDYRSNLREDSYGAYAGFLATVLDHFDSIGLPFSYISPVNEPQWAWADKPGSAGQEGSPWRNEEIHGVVAAVDSALTARGLPTKILVTEAGQLNYLYGGSGGASRQVQDFFGGGNLDLRRYRHMGQMIGAHSYFTEAGDSNLVSIRRRVADTTAKYGVNYWETEYSMLADGWREGTKGGRSAMDCALFLAKVIHYDLTVGNAAAWQFWNAYEPGRADSNTRYYLIALKPNAGFTDGDYYATKGLWALGNFSRWIRPGMRRVLVGRSDGKDDLAAARDVMISAYTDASGVPDKYGNMHGGRTVLVAINYTTQERMIRLDRMESRRTRGSVKSYVTSEKAGDNLTYYPVNGPKWRLPPRSVTTYVIDSYR